MPSSVDVVEEDTGDEQLGTGGGVPSDDASVAAGHVPPLSPEHS